MNESINKSKFAERLHAIACPSVCFSVRLSVCHTDGSVKTVKVRIMQFSPYSSAMPLVFAGKGSSRN